MKNITLLAFLFIMIIALFMLSGGACFAQLINEDLPNREGIKLGGLVLHGAMKAREELDTNVFLTNDNRKFDAITVLAPSGGIEIPLGDNMISADYEGSMYLYGNYPDQNHYDQKARLLGELNLTRYKITLKDTYNDFTDRSADENSRRIQRRINNGRVGISTQMNKLGFDVGYTNLWEVYGQPDDIIFNNITYRDKDRFTNMVDAAVSYRFWPKTSLFFESDLGFITYYNSSLPPDSIFVDFLVGARGRPTNKTRVNIKGGIRYQNYSKSDVMNDKFFFGPVASGGFDFYINDNNILNFGVDMRVLESTYANMNYYYANMVGMKYKHMFTEKLSTTPYAFYQLSLYPGKTVENGVEAKRYDNLYGFGLSVRYDVRKWVSAEIKYEYTQRSSKFDIYDYLDNRVLFNGTVGF